MLRGRLYDGGLTTLLARLQAAVADHYSVACEIGRGGMATVYLGDDLKLERRVAIKLLHPQLAPGLGVERFLPEIETAAGLTPPHVGPLFDCGESGGLLFYVMPYIDGETLRRRLTREGSLPIDDAVRIACEVLEAVGYAHAQGVVHRDIKPENIIFSAGRALVTDFGIARAVSAASLEPLTIDGAVGTPAYMSPEQASQSPQLDGRSDIYSLGCTLYEMLTGSVPFTGPTAQAVMARHLLDVVPPIRSVRPTVRHALEQAVLTALAKVPADRFATAGQFARALNAPDEVTLDGEGGESIAVLPFANLSGDPDFEYFSEGIAEEIINGLPQLPGLRVRPRTPSRAFRGRGLDLRAARRRVYGAGGVRGRATQRGPTQGARGGAAGARAGARPRRGPLRFRGAGFHLRLGLASRSARLAPCRGAESALRHGAAMALVLSGLHRGPARGRRRAGPARPRARPVGAVAGDAARHDAHGGRLLRRSRLVVPAGRGSRPDDVPGHHPFGAGPQSSGQER